MDSTEIYQAEAPRTLPQERAPFWEEFSQAWRALPDKPLFFGLAVLWVLLFHFLGNSTFGYIDTASLFRWMAYCYRNAKDDELGWIIPFVVLVLFWCKRRELLALPARRWGPAAALVAFALLLHLAGYILQQTRISILAFFLGLYGFIGLVWGPAWLKGTLFPMFLFVFCVPLNTVADVITFPLRLVVTKIAVGISHHILGIDVVRNGTQIFDSGGTFQFEVAAACSGIRSLISLFALTSIYGFLTFSAAWKRAFMIALTVPIAVAGNVLRILGIIIAAEAFGQNAGMFMDRWFGFITFAFALVCVFLLGHWLAEKRAPSVPGAGAAGSLAADSAKAQKPAWFHFAVVGVMMAVTAGLLFQWQRHQRLGPPGVKLSGEPLLDASGRPISAQSVSLPAQVLNYSSIPQPISPLELSWLPKDTTFGRRLYTAPDGFGTLISVVVMGTDRTSIHKPEFCLTGQGWVIDQSEEITVPVSRPHPYALPVRKLVTSRSGVGPQGGKQALRGLYLYWFVAENAVTADHKERMWWMARRLVTSGELQRWAYITYFAICYPGQEAETLERLKRFMAASIPEFQLAVPPPRTGDPGKSG